MEILIEAYQYQAIFSGISALTCTFVISLSILFKKKMLAQFETKLVIILLSFYDGLCLASLFPVWIDESCTAQGFLIQFFSLSGILWTGFINLVNYRGVIQKKERSLPLTCPILIILCISILTSTVALVTIKYKESTCWCWFDLHETHSTEETIWKSIHIFGFFYAISWIIIFFIAYAFIRIFWVYQRSNADFSKYKQIIFIPIILLVCFLPLTICRVLQFCTSIELKNYQIFSACLMRSLGFLNCVVYSYNSNIKETLFEAYHIGTVEYEMIGISSTVNSR